MLTIYYSSLMTIIIIGLIINQFIQKTYYLFTIGTYNQLIKYISTYLEININNKQINPLPL